MSAGEWRRAIETMALLEALDNAMADYYQACARAAKDEGAFFSQLEAGKREHARVVRAAANMIREVTDASRANDPPELQTLEILRQSIVTETGYVERRLLSKQQMHDAAQEFEKSATANRHYNATKAEGVKRIETTAAKTETIQEDIARKQERAPNDFPLDWGEKPRDAGNRPEPQVRFAGMNPDSGTGRIRVLAADDEPAMRNLLGDMLPNLGYEVILAEDGLQAWQVLEGNDAPQLALLDVVMPKLKGTDICRNLRRSDKAESVYVILMSGFYNTRAGQDLLECGADDFIAKPFAAKDLNARLEAGKRVTEARNKRAAARAAKRG